MIRLKLKVTSYKLQVTSYKLQATSYELRVARDGEDHHRGARDRRLDVRRGHHVRGQLDAGQVDDVLVELVDHLVNER